MNFPHFDINKIFETNNLTFSSTALDVFKFQYSHNLIYQSFVDHLHIKTTDIRTIEQIPFLPIQFFKSHAIKTTEFDAAVIFTSSGTTGSVNAYHHVKDISIYKQSFISTFESMYGDIKNYCIIGLLPSYLERTGSSLIYMTQNLIELSECEQSGFYLNQFEHLKDTLLYLNSIKKPTILLGVTFALIDFARKYQLDLNNIIVMETGGMKGRGKEITREELHSLLKNNLGITTIHSEYGMTELLSQAYSKGNGKYYNSEWFKCLVRSEDDPFFVRLYGKGLLNVIDLANVYSCSFIATDDIASVNEDDSFDILGRFDKADTRGCSLLTT